jgi:hypothetical protein
VLDGPFFRLGRCGRSFGRSVLGRRLLALATLLRLLLRSLGRTEELR